MEYSSGMPKLVAWDDCYGSRATDEVLLLLSEWHLAQCEVKQEGLEFLVKARDSVALGQLKLDPSSMSCWDYYHHAQIIAFFKKRQDLVAPGVDRKAAAWASFEDAERLNRQTNAIFRMREAGKFAFHPRVEGVLFAAQRKISHILGPVPSLSELRYRFGPGATTRTKKKDASARRKLSSMYACSELSATSIAEVMEEMPSWTVDDGPSEATLNTVYIDDDRIEFAPKTFLTDRTITKTSMLTGMVQLAIGDHMSLRLRKEGVDIRDQTRNQRLARIGSIDGSLGTADLTNASNCVARLLVMDLFPFEWWDLLRRFTSQFVITPDGDRLELEMFSTMGNGFTFPLETLIFYAITKSVVETLGLTGPVAVYGDDIICPSEAFPLLKEVLTATGFVLNSSKSFFEGPFRESCGADWYLGYDVRPYFQKGPLTGANLFVLHNYYVRRGFTVPASSLLQYCQSDWLLWGPDGFGDGHLLTERDVLEPSRRRADGWSGYTFETYTYKPNEVFYELGADYVFPSYSIYIKDRAESGLTGFEQAYGALKKVKKRAVSGPFRPERSDAIYKKVRGRWRLRDVLPGTSGYKRVRIYTLQPPDNGGPSANTLGVGNNQQEATWLRAIQESQLEPT